MNCCQAAMNNDCPLSFEGLKTNDFRNQQYSEAQNQKISSNTCVKTESNFMVSTQIYLGYENKAVWAGTHGLLFLLT